MSTLLSNYGQERSLDATPEELQIFEIVKSTAESDGLRLTRKADNYVTAVIGDWDLARFKFSSRAKWIMFPVVESGSTKHRINEPADAAGFAAELAKSLEHIRKYSDV